MANEILCIGKTIKGRPTCGGRNLKTLRIYEASSHGGQVGVAVRSIVSGHRVKMGGSYAMIEALIINMELNNKYMVGAYMRALSLTAIGGEPARHSSERRV